MFFYFVDKIYQEGIQTLWNSLTSLSRQLDFAGYEDPDSSWTEKQVENIRSSPNRLKQTGLATSSGELRVDLNKWLNKWSHGAWSRSKAMLERMGHGEVFQEECEER